MWSMTPTFQGMVGNPASLLLAHQQLREAANQVRHLHKPFEVASQADLGNTFEANKKTYQAYQNHNSSHLPPGLVQANKSHIHQQVTLCSTLVLVSSLLCQSRDGKICLDAETFTNRLWRTST